MSVSHERIHLHEEQIKVIKVIGVIVKHTNKQQSSDVTRRAATDPHTQTNRSPSESHKVFNKCLHEAQLGHSWKLTEFNLWLHLSDRDNRGPITPRPEPKETQETPACR